MAKRFQEKRQAGLRKLGQHLLSKWSSLRWKLLEQQISSGSNASATELSFLSNADSGTEYSPAEQQVIRELAWLRLTLRDHPYWAQGHQLIVSRALFLKETALAYGSSQALIKLAQSPVETCSAHCSLASVYLAKGMAKEALRVLAGTTPVGTQQLVYRYYSLKAAAEMGIGDSDAAQESLSHIPEEKRDHGDAMVARYLAGDWRQS